MKEDFIETVAHFLQMPSNKNRDSSPQLTKPIFYANHSSQTKETEQAHICLGFEGVGIESDEIYPMMMVNNVLGGSMSSRLFQEIREKDGMAYSIFSYHSSFLDSGLLTIYAGTSKHQLGTVREKIDQVVEQLQTDGLTEKEWMNSKEQLKGLYMLSMESTNSKMSRNARNELLLQDHPSLDDILNKIDRVTVKDINNILELLNPSKAGSAIIAPKE